MTWAEMLDELAESTDVDESELERSATFMAVEDSRADAVEQDGLPLAGEGPSGPGVSDREGLVAATAADEPGSGPGDGPEGAGAAAERGSVVGGPVPGQGFQIDASGARGMAGWGPAGPSVRAGDNVRALQVLRRVQSEDRAASTAEQETLARWTSWGALPKVFDESAAEFDGLREQLRGLLNDTEWTAASRTTLNAHYTSPAYASAMWRALQGLGFEGGQVLEPGCGAGVFMGLAPKGARMTGVELDPVTAGIAQALYPDVTVRTESFARSPFQDGTFDAVIGNVPFADTRLLDHNHNPQRRYSMHNHFILKSLALTRPGGMVAVLTSRWTLDALDDSARRDMLQMADMVTAVRLPTGAHRQVAGTDAVTDLVVFRVRGDDERPPAVEPSWLLTTEVDVPRKENPDELVETDVNMWFREHPELVLGELQVGHGMYNATTLQVRAEDLSRVGESLERALAGQVRDARAAGLVFTDSAAPQPSPERVVAPVAGAGAIDAFDGYISRDAEGRFWQVVDGSRQEMDVPAAQTRQLTGLVQLRDLTMSLLQAEAASAEDTETIGALRAQLNAAYDSYVDRFGPVNTIKVIKQQRWRKDGSQVVARKWPPAMKTFQVDPHSSAVMALEDYNEETSTAKKMPIFTQRVVSARVPATSADNPQDAVAIVLDQTGKVELDRVADLLGVDQQQAREQLGTLVFDDPETGQLLPAAQYLSGNVRRRLDLAREAAVDRPELAVNVQALEEVLPADRVPAQITPTLGCVWIPDSDIQAFLTETLDDRSVRVLNLTGAKWEVQGNKHSQAATSTWGTQRLNAIDMVQRMMQQQKIIIEDTHTDGDGTEYRVVNKTETDAAQEKARKVRERFSEWVWEDPARTERLVADYNRRFNSEVLRSYHDEGQTLTFPGLAAWLTPHDHQRAAVARMRSEPSVGLFHEVGAGKTYTMVIGVMELRRLGLVSKPVVAVPNNMLRQFTCDWLSAYPQANVLTADGDAMTPANRRRFVARAATGDWDAIIMTHTALQKIPVSAAAQEEYMSRELHGLRESLDRAGGDRAFARTVKRIEAKIMRSEERLRDKIESSDRDAGVTWEQLGADYLVVDELHRFKNLGIASQMQGVTAEGGPMTADFDMKLSVLRQKAGPGGRVITGATATPISNTIAEAYTMQHYLRPDLLEEAGFTDFDSWAATFAQEVTGYEVDGVGKFKLTTRLARFQNMHELQRSFRTFGDVMTAEDLGLPRPEIAMRADGERLPEPVLVEPTPQLLDYMRDMEDRIDETLAGHPRTRPSGNPDIRLTIDGDGRRTAIDMAMATRFGDQDEQDPVLDLEQPQKLDAVADRVARIWQENRDRQYPVKADSETMHPVPGALQIVFLDQGTPGGQSWPAYDALRAKLVERGMDADRVAYAQTPKNDAEKERMFEGCRTGKYDVIIGSTPKMGVGTNIQLRAVALHHVDCPWRPDELEQREGRILRQGNANPEIQIMRYATKKSFDAVNWQIVERKAKFVGQFMRGEAIEDQVENIDNKGLQYGQMKAVIADNPLLLQRAELEGEVGRLRRLHSAHGAEQSRRQQQTVSLTNRIDRLTNQAIPALQQAMDQARDTTGDRFAMTIGDRMFTERSKAAAALRAELVPHMNKLNNVTRPEISLPGVAEVGGHPFDAKLLAGTLGTEASAAFRLRATSERPVMVGQSGIDVEGIGLVTRLENRVQSLGRDLEATQAEVAHARKELAEAQSHLGEPFAQQAELVEAQQKLDDVLTQIAGHNKQPNPDQTQHQLEDHADAPTTLPQVAAEQPDRSKEPGQEPDQQQINRAGVTKLRETLAQLRAGRDETAGRDRRHDRDQHHPGPDRSGPSIG